MRFTLILRSFLIATVSSHLSASEAMVYSITHFNATWTFSEPAQTGVFANGEPWVVGPISLIMVTPNNNIVWDETFPGEPGPNSGSMKVTTPNTLQGYLTKSKAIPGWDNSKVYTKSLDISRSQNLPISILPGEIIMTATGQPETGEIRTCINEICVLTVVSTPPPDGSFRPALFSRIPRSVVHNKSGIDFSILTKLAQVEGTPTQVQIETSLPALPWFEFDNTWLQSSFGPANNFAASRTPVSYPSASSVYGREIAYKWGEVALWLNTNQHDSVKEKAIIQTIQCGLDIASFVRNGGVFASDGGHKIGRKFPMLLAGLALKDQELLTLVEDQNARYFSEDQSTFFVKSTDVGRLVAGGQDAQYLESDIGLPDWGVKHASDPFSDDRRWAADGDNGGVYYRYVTWPAMVGSVLAIHLMGKQQEWNHPAIFAYTERFKNRHGIGLGFDGQMWNKHWKPRISDLPAPKDLKITR